MEKKKSYELVQNQRGEYAVRSTSTSGLILTTPDKDKAFHQKFVDEWNAKEESLATSVWQPINP